MKKVQTLGISTLGLMIVALAAGTIVWADHHEGEHHSHGGEPHSHAKGDHGHKASTWFDAGSCEICKPWSENPALMMNTKWETHTTKNGMLMVSTAPEGKLKKFNAVCKQMDANIEQISKGDKVPHLCGFCQAMGGVVQSGAQIEKVQTQFGNITLVTASNPETVKQIHQVAKRSQEEAKKMEAMMKMKKAG